MKIDAEIEKNPQIKSVTLTLTPREAYLLAFLLGNTNYEDRLRIINDNDYTETLWYCPKKYKQKATRKEAQNLDEIYADIKDIFEDRDLTTNQ